MVVEENCRRLGRRGAGCDAYHYCTGGGAEVDLVLDGDERYPAEPQIV